jgi:hypothetical protein
VKKRARRRAIELLGAEPVLSDDGANFFGHASRKGFEIRGNGCLALGDSALVFVMWWPRREHVIELAKVTAVESVSSHAGKWIGSPLLRVSFEGDSMAWWVRDLDSWLASLTP